MSLNEFAWFIMTQEANIFWWKTNRKLMMLCKTAAGGKLRVIAIAHETINCAFKCHPRFRTHSQHIAITKDVEKTTTIASNFSHDMQEREKNKQTILYTIITIIICYHSCNHYCISFAFFFFFVLEKISPGMQQRIHKSSSTYHSSAHRGGEKSKPMMFHDENNEINICSLKTSSSL